MLPTWSSPIASLRDCYVILSCKFPTLAFFLSNVWEKAKATASLYPWNSWRKIFHPFSSMTTLQDWYSRVRENWTSVGSCLSAPMVKLCAPVEFVGTDKWPIAPTNRLSYSKCHSTISTQLKLRDTSVVRKNCMQWLWINRNDATTKNLGMELKVMHLERNVYFMPESWSSREIMLWPPSGARGDNCSSLLHHTCEQKTANME